MKKEFLIVSICLIFPDHLDVQHRRLQPSHLQQGRVQVPSVGHRHGMGDRGDVVDRHPAVRLHCGGESERKHLPGEKTQLCSGSERFGVFNRS